MTRTEIIAKAAQQVEEKIALVRDYHPSQYFTIRVPTTDDEESDDWAEVRWDIRVSNHKANPERVGDNTIIFLVDVPERETDEEELQTWFTAKKSFRDVENQISLNDENCNEWNESVLEILTEKCL